MIKYLGSKRRLVAALTAAARATGANTALDLFSGTTRVSQAFKRIGLKVTAVDSADFAHTLAECYVATDADTFDRAGFAAAVDELSALPGIAGYVTDVFCHRSRYFQPHNGMRIDAIRDGLEDWAGTPLHPVLLTSLLEAADRVDSTTGLQMAYLKQWAPRSSRLLELRSPVLLPGPGSAHRMDLGAAADGLPAVDLAYLDPPYNQHRYDANYHVWNTLVRWDAPEHYGVACKRIDLRDPHRRSPFNSRRTFAPALRRLIGGVRASTVMVSYNDESWISAEELTGWLLEAGHARVVAFGFDSARYVGAQIGIHNPRGERVGTVGRRRNVEWLFVAGDAETVAGVAAALPAHGGFGLGHPENMTSTSSRG